MPISLNLLVNPSLVGPPPVPTPAFPPSGQLLVTVQSATADGLAASTQRALLDVQERNVEIIAKLGPSYALWISDATLSGGGDGHTFVLEILFVSAQINLLGQLVALLGLGISLAPENFRFQFALAGDAENLPPLYDPMLQTLFDTVPAPPFQPQAAIGIFNLWAGAAKGTRFMMGVGALLAPEEQQLRASASSAAASPRTMSDVLAAARAMLKK